MKANDNNSAKKCYNIQKEKKIIISDQGYRFVFRECARIFSNCLNPIKCSFPTKPFQLITFTLMFDILKVKTKWINLIQTKTKNINKKQFVSQSKIKKKNFLIQWKLYLMWRNVGHRQQWKLWIYKFIHLIGHKTFE